MKAPQDIILKPVVTEKSTQDIANKKYVFEVAPGANKIEIAKAVESLFKVEVKKVGTVNVKGKKKRVGVHSGYTADRKKAYVTLTEKSKTIDFFDGLM